MGEVNHLPSGSDARLEEIAELARYERRGLWVFYVVIAAVLLLFSFIGFIPGPLHEYAEYASLRLLGHVGSRAVIFGAGIVTFLAVMTLGGAVAVLRSRHKPAVGDERLDRLEKLRKQLLAEGFSLHQLGKWTVADWKRLVKRVAVICTLLGVVAIVAFYALDRWVPVGTGVPRSVHLGVDGTLDNGPVLLRATARLDSAFWISEDDYGTGVLSGSIIDIFRLDQTGFAPRDEVLHQHTLFVPLTGPSWRPGQPIRVFYECVSACAVSATEGAARGPVDVTLNGQLRRSGLPLFVRRTFEQAGITVATPYYVLVDHEDSREWIAITALISFSTAVFLFTMPAAFAWSNQRQLRKQRRRGI